MQIIIDVCRPSVPELTLIDYGKVTIETHMDHTPHIRTMSPSCSSHQTVDSPYWKPFLSKLDRLMSKNYLTDSLTGLVIVTEIKIVTWVKIYKSYMILHQSRFLICQNPRHKCTFYKKIS